MNDVSFTHTALKDYIKWQTEERKTLKKINDLIEDILRNRPMEGIGKPEPLKTDRRRFRRGEVVEEHESCGVFVREGGEKRRTMQAIPLLSGFCWTLYTIYRHWQTGSGQPIAKYHIIVFEVVL
jgi:Txe/YoeB family toxin of toxin-antitoxin system